MDDNLIVDDQRRSGVAPPRWLQSCHLTKFGLPFDVPSLRIQTHQMAACSKHEEITVCNRGSRAWAGTTDAILDLDMQALEIKGIHLELKASVIDGVDEAKFKEVAEGAKSGCIVSKALNVPITLNVTYA